MAGVIKSTLLLAAPALGPTVVKVLEVEIPVFSLVLSTIGLILARQLAPASVRKLNKRQEIVLTFLLLLLMFLIVTGQLWTDRPLEAGEATVLGIGLGWTGLLVLEIMGDRFSRALGILLGWEDKKPKQYPLPLDDGEDYGIIALSLIHI